MWRAQPHIANFLRICAHSTPPQGHIKAAALVGGIYYNGQGVAIDYLRSRTAYKVAAEGGQAHSPPPLVPAPAAVLPEQHASAFMSVSTTVEVLKYVDMFFGRREGVP